MAPAHLGRFTGPVRSAAKRAAFLVRSSWSKGRGKAFKGFKLKDINMKTSSMSLHVHSVIYVITGIVTSVLNQLVSYEGLSEESTLILPLATYLGMFGVALLPESFFKSEGSSSSSSAAAAARSGSRRSSGAGSHGRSGDKGPLLPQETHADMEKADGGPHSR